LAPMLGASFGPIFPYLLVPFEEGRPFQQSRNLVSDYFIYMTIFITFFFVLGILFLKCFDNVYFKEEEISNRVSESRLIRETLIEHSKKDSNSLIDSKSKYNKSNP
jgi:hypothetical protein